MKESIKKESTSGKKPRTETENSKTSGAEPTQEERIKPNDPPKIDMPQNRIYKNKKRKNK